ncbi:hypothetical protein PINS_up009616 [Pythium insidiosum]|nr:hypothetical protein PINS_up009616 [Pythium insidiosum]
MDGAPSQCLVVDRLDAALNFFDLKAREYAGMQYASVRLATAEKMFLWKSCCAAVMYVDIHTLRIL